MSLSKVPKHDLLKTISGQGGIVQMQMLAEEGSSDSFGSESQQNSKPLKRAKLQFESKPTISECIENGGVLLYKPMHPDNALLHESATASPWLQIFSNKIIPIAEPNSSQFSCERDGFEIQHGYLQPVRGYNEHWCDRSTGKVALQQLPNFGLNQFRR